MINLIEIGKTIMRLRLKHQMTQQELADRLYVTHQAISKWENGKTLPVIEVMVELTKLFNITIDELIHGVELESHNDFSKLLTTYSRKLVIQQLVKGRLPDVKLEDILYLLSQEERMIIISHIINHHYETDLIALFPYLNSTERHRLVNAYLSDKITLNLKLLTPMLSASEKRLIKGGKK